MEALNSKQRRAVRTRGDAAMKLLYLVLNNAAEERHSLEFVSWKDRKPVVPALRAIYRTPKPE